ncbi:PRC-barrel domain-containing protein [Aquibium sp. ELW1220]|uniref:PRC-barrel domain-containing protein n=1 Tax=Aquibium sp. ELW1220 TaxID=2976766 RepID=UPI0025AF201B|nr:PRC-barrel domain-containing protein [Aquibium sp. ELW1220]MDN2581743.1 PRC-barrel domain-containing protein [Aquibium sp. ELW1220]
MFLKLASTTAIAAGGIAILSAPAMAQTAPRADTQISEACIYEMNDFAERMNENEFWLTGWGTGAYGVPPGPQSTRTSATTSPATGGTSTTVPGAGTASGTATMAADPRGAVVGIDAPRYQIRALYSAARVLAHRGDGEGCQYVVAKMNEVYDGYSQQLQEAGVDPASVATWRQEQLALAEPVSGREGMSSYRIDDITGTDVRNVEDENLGSVSDVVIDPQTGQASYVIVARGGFLGIGEDHYAVPWSEIRATPGLDTIVLDRGEAELEQAPSIDPDRFRASETMMEERRATDAYWQAG